MQRYKIWHLERTLCLCEMAFCFKEELTMEELTMVKGDLGATGTGS